MSKPKPEFPLVNPSEIIEKFPSGKQTALPLREEREFVERFIRWSIQQDKPYLYQNHFIPFFEEHYPFAVPMTYWVFYDIQKLVREEMGIAVKSTAKKSTGEKDSDSQPVSVKRTKVGKQLYRTVYENKDVSDEVVTAIMDVINQLNTHLSLGLELVELKTGIEIRSIH